MRRVERPLEVNVMLRTFRAFPIRALAPLAGLLLHSTLSGCAAESGQSRVEGQDSFESAPFPSGGARGLEDSAATGAPAADAGSNGSTATRTVEETDLYRLEGDRLYYLNSYRGLMVFDVSNVTQPRLLGRMPIYGYPVEMIVRNGIATVVVSDWYGQATDGTPFHGSIVRGIDATNPASIHTIGEAQLGGWVRDTRVVGDVLYAISEDYPSYYGWYSDGVATTSGPSMVISSVSFAGGNIQAKARRDYPGWSAIMNVSADAILLGHGNRSDYQQNATSDIAYLDISDPTGLIVEKSHATVAGDIQGWGQDNGRFNIDYQPSTHHARILTQRYDYNNGGGNAVILSTVDFTNPSAPAALASVALPNVGYSDAARFDGDKLYLSSYQYDTNQSGTPVRIFDLADDANPHVAGQLTVPGSIFAFFPNGDRVFALGNNWNNGQSSSALSLHYIDVTNKAAPVSLGAAKFGEGWAWTPAANTFKAFAQKADENLVALPFSGWSYQEQQYRNGVQLIAYTANSITTKGAARTKGWVERGIFIKGKLVSLSDQALSVTDYTNPASPQVVAELTLARNIVDARPVGGNVALLSSDWWGNDRTTSELRTVPAANADEDTSVELGKLALEGSNARLHKNGNFGYVVTTVTRPAACDPNSGTPRDPSGTSGCVAYVPHVTVVDFTTPTPSIRGQLDLPAEDDGYGYGYYGGCYWYDWYGGESEVLVNGSALAFRRMHGHYDQATQQYHYDQKLYVVDVRNPNAPSVASTTINTDLDGWWGNLRVVGNELMTTHYEWIQRPDPRDPGNTQYRVRYYLDRIDLTNLAAPQVKAKVNVPGVLVGASETDPNQLYFVDYRWNNGNEIEDFDVVRLVGNRAVLQSKTELLGYTGRVFVKGNHALTTVQRYNWMQNTPTDGPTVQLHDIDLSNPRRPVDRAASAKNGWGWLLDVTGDRALVTSGWGNEGVDVYRLGTAAPQFEQFVRTHGWWTENVAREGNQLFLASGYYGVQQVTLNP
jgi:hypothetical protein